MNRVPTTIIDRENNAFGWPHHPAETMEEVSRPFLALGEAVVDSIIPLIHSTDDAMGDELKNALLIQFSTQNPDIELHRPVMRVVKDLGFELNPKAAETRDFINHPLLILLPQKHDSFRQYFPDGFKFLSGLDLIDYFHDLDAEFRRSRNGSDYSYFQVWTTELKNTVMTKPFLKPLVNLE